MSSPQLDNVTTRRRRQKSSDEPRYLSLNSSGSITRGNSLPDLSTHINTDEVEELRHEIITLKSELKSAHNEIESLIICNIKLEADVLELQKRAGLLQKICGDTAKKTPASNSRKSQIKPKRLKLTQNDTSTPLHHFDPPTVTVREPVEPKPQLQEQSKCTEIKTPAPIASQKTTAQSSEKRPDATIKCNKRILIFGGQQCTGLASAVINSRRDTKYEKYEVMSYIKSNASCEEILKSCYNTNITESDKVIICVGENDKNPIQLSMELSHFIKTYYKSTVIIVNILQSQFLNENKLNNMLQILCQNSINCKYVNIKKFFKNRHTYLKDLSHELNIMIDTIDYNEKFLCNKLEKHLPKANPLKKGTIPYYFHNMVATRQKRHEENLEISENFQNSTVNTKVNINSFRM